MRTTKDTTKISELKVNTFYNPKLREKDLHVNRNEHPNIEYKTTHCDIARDLELLLMRSWGLMRNLIERYMHRGREKAVANTPHFTIIFTVFYFIQKNVDTRRKTLHLLLPLPPSTRPSPTHPLPKTLTHPPFDPHPPTLCPRYYY